MSNKIPKIPEPILPKRGEYSRLDACNCCILKNGRGKTADEVQYYHDGIETMARENKGIWTCAKSLWGREEDKTFMPQCQMGMKDYTKKQIELGMR